MDARVEEEHLFAATPVPTTAFFCAGEIEEFACDTLFGCEDDAVFGEDAEDGARVRDGLHCILNCGSDRRVLCGRAVMRWDILWYRRPVGWE